MALDAKHRSMMAAFATCADMSLCPRTCTGGHCQVQGSLGAGPSRGGWPAGMPGPEHGPVSAVLRQGVAGCRPPHHRPARPQPRADSGRAGGSAAALAAAGHGTGACHAVAAAWRQPGTPGPQLGGAARASGPRWGAVHPRVCRAHPPLLAAACLACPAHHGCTGPQATWLAWGRLSARAPLMPSSRHMCT